MSSGENASQDFSDIYSASSDNMHCSPGIVPSAQSDAVAAAQNEMPVDSEEQERCCPASRDAMEQPCVHGSQYAPRPDVPADTAIRTPSSDATPAGGAVGSRAIPRSNSVLELFCGIGGMRLALSYAGFNVEKHIAVDIHDGALAVYHHNWPDAIIVRKNITSLTAEWFRAQNCNIWTMSPPCQPFSRQGNCPDMKDPRCMALLHICAVIWHLEEEDLPKLLVLENVAGFELSAAYDTLQNHLVAKGYRVQPYMLSPSQSGFPNSRLRFFFTAILDSVETPDVAEICRRVCCNDPYGKVFLSHYAIHPDMPLAPNDESRCVHNSARMLEASGGERWQISQFLDHQRDHAHLEITSDMLKKRSAASFDIVFSTCAHSMCFTKNYGRYVQGTGSVVVLDGKSSTVGEKATVQIPKDDSETGKQKPCVDISVEEWTGRLRHFHPNEVLRLMGFKLHRQTRPDAPSFVQPVHHPDHRCLPCKCAFRSAPCRCEEFELPPMDIRALWKLCGNSLNPQVLGQLLMELPEKIRS